MKQKVALVNLFLMAVVLIATAFQSFHALSHHIGDKKAETTLVLSDAHNQAHWEAADHADDHTDCSICDFHFAHFVQPTPLSLRVPYYHTPIHYSFSSIEGQPNFEGALFAHRGPPSLG